MKIHENMWKLKIWKKKFDKGNLKKEIWKRKIWKRKIWKRKIRKWKFEKDHIFLYIRKVERKLNIQWKLKENLMKIRRSSSRPIIFEKLSNLFNKQDLINLIIEFRSLSWWCAWCENDQKQHHQFLLWCMFHVDMCTRQMIDVELPCMHK